MADEHSSGSKGGAVRESAAEMPRSNTRRNIFIVAIVLVLVAGGLFLWRYLGSYESTDDAQVDAHLYPVSARVFRLRDSGKAWMTTSTCKRAPCSPRSIPRITRLPSTRPRPISRMRKQPR